MEKIIKICRLYITVKGVRKYAKDQGLKAFLGDISIEKHRAFLEKKKSKNLNQIKSIKGSK